MRKSTQYRENQFQKISCRQLQKRVKKELERLSRIDDRKSKRYNELIEQWHQLKAYERYFELPSTIWTQTCCDKFYSFLYASEVERKEQERENWFLKYRIAASVGQNRGFTEKEFNAKNFY